jgi:uncharacterized protein
MPSPRLLVAALLLMGLTSACAQDAPTEKKEHKANRLAKEKSPYLRQHMHNPVDWYPWGEEAFAKAKKENKVVFISIGYATCHWCHVMERESFENEDVGAFMNTHFVSIKVDREERPDVDEIYMTAVQQMTGGGGWPLSVFLTPDGVPFTGGTYFPQPARFGRKSFLEVLNIVKDLWLTKEKDIIASAESIRTHLAKVTGTQPPATELTKAVLRGAFEQLRASFDVNAGGFTSGGTTKFPMPHNVSYLLRYHRRTGEKHALTIVRKTLDAMLEGGLRDHLGGGFHRYSTDKEWQIPHFEKMLYDQAGLVRAYTEAYQVTGEAKYAAVARETMDFVLRDMTSPEGPFTSAWDADSEGVEGKCYVWTPEEVEPLLGAEAYPLFAARYSITKAGNFHEFPGKTHLQFGKSLAQLSKSSGKTEAELEAIFADCRAKLFAVREKRVPPLHDDKLLTDWNGLMIGSAAVAGRGLSEPAYLQAAIKAADFLVKTLKQENGRWLHRYRDGDAAIPAMLEDYAFLAWGLLELFEATQDPRWLSESKALATVMIEDLWDAKAGGFFLCAADALLINRPKPTYDGAIPSGNSAAALVLSRLGHLTQDAALLKKGDETLRWYSALLSSNGGNGATLGLQALDVFLGPRREVVIAGDPAAPETRAMLAELNRRFLPRTAVIQRPLKDAAALVARVPYIEGQIAIEGKPTAYVCEAYACKRPVQTASELASLLDALAKPDGLPNAETSKDDK